MNESSGRYVIGYLNRSDVGRPFCPFTTRDSFVSILAENERDAREYFDTHHYNGGRRVMVSCEFAPIV